MSKKKPTTTKNIANKALEPLIEWKGKTRGGMANICTLFNDGLEKPIGRNVIERWLHPETEKRTEPIFGAGLRLLEVWQLIQLKEVQEKHVLTIKPGGGFCQCGETFHHTDEKLMKRDYKTHVTAAYLETQK